MGECDVGSDLLAVEIETHFARHICSVCPHSGLLEAAEYFSPRMSIAVVRADRDDGVARVKHRQQIRRSGAGTAVMSDLEDHSLRMLGHNAALSGPFRISFQ